MTSKQVYQIEVTNIEMKFNFVENYRIIIPNACCPFLFYLPACTNRFIFPPGPVRYVDEMDREQAQIMLDPCPDGTFLIRRSTNRVRLGAYSLSIK